jgi:conjugal transfer pilus assembly protein TraV
MYKNSLIFMLLLLLNGCSSMNAQFDCPMQPGVHCESLDQVNSRVDRGEIGQEVIATSLPIRQHDTVLPIWIAPYEDNDGNYHKEQEIYAVLKPGHWQEHPFKNLEV